MTSSLLHLCGESAVLGSLLYLLIPPPGPTGEPGWREQSGIKIISEIIKSNCVTHREALRLGVADSVLHLLHLDQMFDYTIATS